MNQWMINSRTNNFFFEESKNEWKKKKVGEQNGWNKILSKNEWMVNSIEHNGWNRISSKNEWMLKVLNKMDETRFRARMNEWMNGKTIEQIILLVQDFKLTSFSS
jgi:hypothetical protein